MSFFLKLVVIMAVIANCAAKHSSLKKETKEVTENLFTKRAETPKYSAMKDDEIESLFEDFKVEFGKVYDDEKEEKKRLKKFKKFLSTVDERNEAEEKAGGSAIHGITQFADLTNEEFEEMYLNYQIPSDEDKFPESSETFEYNGAATAVNWAGLLTTPIKNQGNCGSCWAFSAAQQIESAGIKAGILTTADILSTQQMVSCDTATSAPAAVIAKNYQNSGCSGGNQQKAYFYVYNVGGLTTEALYPYTSGTKGVTGTCDTTKTAYKIKTSTPTLGATVSGEAAQIAYVLGTGPLTAAVDASKIGTYKSGIISAAACTTSINHAVQIVGVDTVNNYWIVRNSWGSSWGASGYFWLQLNANTCGIAAYCTYVNVAKV